MSDQLVFKHDAIVVYHVDGIHMGKPTLSIDSKLDEVMIKSSGHGTYAEFEQWAETQKYPILCSVELQDGVYPASMFKLFSDPLKSFGKDLSHYQYLKISQPITDQTEAAVTGSPFDEDLTTLSNETDTEDSSHLTTLFKTKLHQLEKFMCHMLLSEGLSQEKNMGNSYKSSDTTVLKKRAN